MASVYKILGQVAPSATTETALYTVPALTSAVVSTLVICNRGGTATTARVSVSAGGGATANKDYIIYDLAIPANEQYMATVGITMATTDRMRVYAGNGNLSFSVFGSEIT